MRKRFISSAAIVLAAAAPGIGYWNTQPVAAAPPAAVAAGDKDGTLVVTVVDAKGKPVANASVILSDADDSSRQRASASTNGEGKATIHYRGGQYQLRAVGGAADSGLTAAALVAGKTSNVQVTVRGRTR